jgi:hypothetical protein
MRVKIHIQTLLLLIFVIGCKNDVAPTLNLKSDPLSNALISSDQSVFNHESLGQFVYTHVKYYSGTLNPVSFLPKDMQTTFKQKYNDYVQKTAGWSYSQIVDDLVSQKAYTATQGEILKRDHQALLDYINTKPSSSALVKWYQQRESEISENTNLTLEERVALLNNKAMMKYALKWKIEQIEFNEFAKSKTNSLAATRTETTCDSWTTLACYVGNIANGGGTGNSVGLALSLLGDAFSGAGEVGAAIGVILGAITGVETCACPGPNSCQAPATVAFPYTCYSYGNNLLCEAFGYGSPKPGQFTYQVAKNDNIAPANIFWSTFTANDYTWIPGSYLNTSVTDIAVMVNSLCNLQGGNYPSAWYGWFNLSTLGQPFFSISGNGNISLSQTGSGWYYTYFATGPVSSANATVTWQVIPSGYPNYSATGTIVSGGNSGASVTVMWNHTAGFANLKCTAVSACGTIVQYYTIHVQ